ncbi:MAG: polyprenyl synthetase family protein [Anaerolineaceae bacterium]|nr:polyprenyl synthetase family protein [Anaerolineaceae bacterium]
MYFEKFLNSMQPDIEARLKQEINNTISEEFSELRKMLSYHMGWAGERTGSNTQGKRLRPLLLLISNEAVGSDWKKALPIAAAVELINNFSLIHDDIQDNSHIRRGRDTVWVKWGIPQAINAGDLMFTIAHLSLLAIQENFPPEITLKTSQIVLETCVRLTKGQFQDMFFENDQGITLEKYWGMIERKTAALISSCTQLGAILGNSGTQCIESFREFGLLLGLAFQVQDDWLGIWGNSGVTGKSTESDLVSGKKTLPVLYAIQNDPKFSKLWSKGTISVEEAPNIAEMLINNGTQKFTQNTVEQLTTDALNVLKKTKKKNDAIEALKELALQLTFRNN